MNHLLTQESFPSYLDLIKGFTGHNPKDDEFQKKYQTYRKFFRFLRDYKMVEFIPNGREKTVRLTRFGRELLEDIKKEFDRQQYLKRDRDKGGE